MTEEQIQEVKTHMTPSLYAANYELRFIASDDVIFTDPKLGAKQSMVEGGEAHVDAAYFGEDYTAFTACQKHDGKFYVYGKIWRRHVDEVTPFILSEIQRLRLTRLHMENNADKGYSLGPFKSAGVKCVPYHESQNKHIKIVTYLKTSWPEVVFTEGTDDAYINQICDYNEDAEHDDAPDSLSSILQRGRFRVKPYEPKLGKGTTNARARSFTHS